MRHPRTTRTAFTLIELLAVIAIIALLMALVVPAISAARDAFNANNCRNNMRQISLALVHYATDFGKLPGNANDPANLQWVRVTGGPALLDQRVGGVIMPYLEQNPKVFICPSLKGNGDVGGEKVACHYAMPTAVAGLPLDKIHGAFYTDADGVKQTLAGLPLVVEPVCYKDDSGVIQNDLGVYDALGGTWTTLPTGGFEGAHRMDAHRHTKNIHIAYHNTTSGMVENSSADLAAGKVTIQLTTGKEIKLDGTHTFESWAD